MATLPRSGQVRWIGLRPARGVPILDWQLAALGDYELVLIDCPPNLGALTFDALTAASHALIVTEPTFLALRALDELLNTLEHVTAERNPSLELAGVMLNRVEATAEHKRGVAEIEESFGSRVWEPHIPKRAVLQDAMRLGVPTVVSDAGALPEVCGDASLYCDPVSDASIAGALLEVATNAALRESLRARGIERARRFSWERCATDTAGVLSDVLA